MSAEPEDAEIVEVPKNGHPSHRMSPWPDHVKILIRTLWMNGMTPMKIAENINDQGFLSKPIHANTISQFLSQEKRKDPEIAVEREKTKEEFKEAALVAASEMKETILGKIKESTLVVFSETTDHLPRHIRHLLQLLDENEGDPKMLREITLTLKMQVEMLSKLSGADIMARVQEYRGKKQIDVEFHGSLNGNSDEPKNVTPSIVEIEGWTHR